MNLIEGTMKDGVFRAEGTDLTIEPAQADVDKLKAYEGKKVIAGIRSERFIPYDGQEKNTFSAFVDVIENLGKEQSIYVKLNNDKDFVITMPGHYNFPQGQEYKFAIDNEAMHYFDGETTLRIN